MSERLTTNLVSQRSRTYKRVVLTGLTFIPYQLHPFHPESPQPTSTLATYLDNADRNHPTFCLISLRFGAGSDFRITVVLEQHRHVSSLRRR